MRINTFFQIFIVLKDIRILESKNSDFTTLNFLGFFTTRKQFRGMFYTYSFTQAQKGVQIFIVSRVEKPSLDV